MTSHVPFKTRRHSEHIGVTCFPCKAKGHLLTQDRPAALDFSDSGIFQSTQRMGKSWMEKGEGARGGAFVCFLLL